MNMNITVTAMSDLEMWNLVVGFFTPFVVAVLNRPNLRTWVRSAVAFVVSVGTGGLTAFFSGNYDGQTLVSSILLTLVAAITTYEGLWKPTGIVPAVERWTSPRWARNAASKPVGRAGTLGR